MRVEILCFDCPDYQDTPALVDRVRSELGVGARSMICCPGGASVVSRRRQTRRKTA
jgi:hypothetical protein